MVPQKRKSLHDHPEDDESGRCHRVGASAENPGSPSGADLDKIWTWNQVLPPFYRFCMNYMITTQSQRWPNKIAIDSWDGSLTFTQVDQYSTFVASLLRSYVHLHDVLLVCFEKSRWTIIAVLAIMKSGATFVLIDPTLPLARIQNMAKQVSAKAILTSRQQHDLSSSILPGGCIVIVDEDTFLDYSRLHLLSYPEDVAPSTLMYIIFTSGSTGTPKGVKISHETYTSSAIPRAAAVGYDVESRVLDFASYAFDVSIDSMLLTLANGGCLCIPSEEDRVNDINGVIRSMKINYAGLTPSLARILEPDVISSLRALGLGGEAVSTSDVSLWGKETRIVIGYGPCECTIGCTINSSAATGRDYISIGRGNGAVIWIVDPNDHNSLMSLGEVGELLIEGPIVGQGYLDDPDKTTAAFIRDPSWLVNGHRSYKGRRGRLYKTGDLGKYDLNGCGDIVFSGRKDTQVKLRGQRVELSEIETQLKVRLPLEINLIAEVIVPFKSVGQAVLVIFITTQSNRRQQHAELLMTQFDHSLLKTLSEVGSELARVLPRYMVPSNYIPVNHIPVLISGKTDRKRLKQFGASLDLVQLCQSPTSRDVRQLNKVEERLRKIWSQTLKVDQDTISAKGNFFALGGDSLTAMKLVCACRAQDLDLNFANIFNHPTLSDMASFVAIDEPEARPEILPFAFIKRSHADACLEASQACKIDSRSIEDIYPCTATQESLFTFSLRSTVPYIAQRIACIPPHVDLETWKQAWHVVIAATPMLRTRLVQLQESGLQQVVSRETVCWTHVADLEKYLEMDRSERMGLGQRLARYAIVDDPTSIKRYMVWTIHHVLYDGWSEPLVLQAVHDALCSRPLVRHAQMIDFVQYVRTSNEVALHNFWEQELKNAVGPQFPKLPSRDFQPNLDSLLEQQINIQTDDKLSYTMATLIRGAWALVASQYTGSDDVIFGETLTGRDISLRDVESIVGPLIATVPVRIGIDRNSSVQAFLHSVQQGVLARSPYQHMGMQNIRKVSRDAQYACEAGTGLVIQPESEYVGSELGFDQEDVVREALHFNPYPVMLAFGLCKTGFRVCASFDTSLVDIPQMRRIFAQLEVTCSRLASNMSGRVGEISCLPQAELDQIWTWNQMPPISLDESSKSLRASGSVQQGSIYPPAAVHWVCNPCNPALLSPIGTVGELWLEGAFLSDKSDCLPWLAAGSSTFSGRQGRLQSTGDLVQLQDNGNLKFLGRKDDILPVQGYAVDIPGFESRVRNYISDDIQIAAALIRPVADSVQHIWEQDLVLFIEQQPLDGEDVKLMTANINLESDSSNPQSFKTSICAMISNGLALALKRLDKFIQDNLPSYMIPSGYVVIDKLPWVGDKVDHSMLNLLASKLPHNVVAQLREGFRTTWTTCGAHTSLTIAERILQSSWARVLSIDAEQIDIHDNFFRLGGDSVLAMKLISGLRAIGHGLTVADIFQNMRLVDAAKVLKINQENEEKDKPYKAFSMLGEVDVNLFLSQFVRPHLADPTCSIQDVYPVTDSQALDVRATIQKPRTSVQYTMLHFDQTVDRGKLRCACDELVGLHDILRTVFIDYGLTLLQVVLQHDLKLPIAIQRTESNLESTAKELCTADIESNFQLGSSFFKLFHIEKDDGQHCLVMRLSHAQFDGICLPQLLRDLETLYMGGPNVRITTFSSYLWRVQNVSLQSQAMAYWRNLLQDSSLTPMPYSSPVSLSDTSVFRSTMVDISQRPSEITTANVLTAAWSLLLARRLRTSDVTFGNITTGRAIDVVNIDTVMGPCYQFMPVRIKFSPEWRSIDLLHFVQRQSAESAAHDFLGFKRISEECTKWSSLSATVTSASTPEPRPTCFASVTHHQDFEEFDVMPFAGGTARTDILNPHGDAADPFKVVSFVRNGKTHFGVVGVEKEKVLVEELLADLIAIVGELLDVNESEEKRLLSKEVFSQS